MESNEIVSQLAKLDERDKSKEHRIRKLEQDNIALNRLVVISELHQKSLESINQALLKISDSNQVIAYEVQGLKNDIAEVKTDVDIVTQKVESIESADNLNIPSTLKKTVVWFLSAIVTGIAGYILYKFGIKN